MKLANLNFCEGKMSKITINDKEYALDALSEEAKVQIVNLRAADAKLAQLQQEVAFVQTARNAYAQVLASHLPK